MSGAMIAAASAGGGVPVLSLVASSYSAETTDPGTAIATFDMDNLGIASGGPTLVSGDDYYNWLSNGVAANYEVRATLTSGTFSSGTAGSWIALSTSRQWRTSKTGLGNKTTSANFEIRRVSDSVVVAGPTSITLDANVTL